MLLLLTDMIDRVRLAAHDERGEVTIEWGILVVFIALALITVVGVIVGGIEGWFTNIADFIKSVPGDPTTPA